MLSLPFLIYTNVAPKAASEGGCEDSAGPCVLIRQCWKRPSLAQGRVLPERDTPVRSFQLEASYLSSQSLT